MPLFYFDVRDAQGVHRDDTGVELPDMPAAILEGRRALADMGRDAIAQGDPHNLEILIRDHGDGPVRLALSITTERVEDDGAS